MEGPKKMMYDKSGPKLVQALEKRNMEGYYCSTVEEAVAKVLELIPQEHTVSWGGVMTADQLGIKQKLARRGQPLIDRDTAKTPEERDELAQDIQKEAHWLIRVTENILSVTKFTGSDVKLKKEDEAVEEIVSSAIVKFRRHHPEMSITVKRPESILWAPMDATLVEQVLLNLFENAAAHGKNANTIQVSILPEPGRAAVVVEDNGAGFSPEALEHLFDGLQPAGTGHSDNRRHMGIGLNVCRSIIRAHGGEITAGNGREGGAEIRFWLPREEEEEQDE